MRVDHELRRLLVAELCAIVDGIDQYGAAALLRLHQPHISALRRGRGAGFSVSRLLRLIAAQGHDIEVQLRLNPRRFATPRKLPSVSVVRYDRYGRPLARDPSR